MRVVINSESLNACIPNFGSVGSDNKNVDEYRLDLENYSAVIRNNLAFEVSPGRYYLSILVRRTQYEINDTMESLLPFLAVFGFPIAQVSYSAHLEAAIMDPKGRILKAYNAKGTDTEYFGFRGGYNIKDAKKTALVTALINACHEIKSMLEKDAGTIKSLIK